MFSDDITGVSVWDPGELVPVSEINYTLYCITESQA